MGFESNMGGIVKYIRRSLYMTISYRTKYSKVTKKRLRGYKIRGEKTRFYVREKSSDFLVLNDIIGTKSYNVPIDFEVKTILDVGANVGIGTLYFNHQFPHANIIAIEAEKENYEILRINTQAYSNIYTMHKAIWDKDNIQLRIKGDDTENKAHEWGFYTQKVESYIEEGTIQMVETITLDTIVDKFSIDEIHILKMDIEGAEKEVFESDSCEWIKITKMLIVETHDKMKKGCTKALFKALESYNYIFEIKGENLVFIFEH